MQPTIKLMLASIGLYSLLMLVLILCRYALNYLENLELKNKSLSAISFDIRTQLNSIMSVTHLSLNTPMSDALNSYLGEINSSSKNILAYLRQLESPIKRTRFSSKWKADLSFFLRTEVTNINGFAYLLSPYNKEYMELILKSSDKILELVST